MANFSSFHKFYEDVNLKITKGSLNDALCSIHDYVDKIITEPLFTANFIDSDKLDFLCQEIGRKNLDRMPKVDFRINQQKKYTYVATKIQKSGGHARVIEDFIKTIPEAEHVILISGIEGRSNIKKFLERFNNIKVTLESSPSKNYLTTLNWLQKRLIELQADNNYLFNHHQDSVAVAAFQPNMMKKAAFYHHGDHHLCLGVHLNHLDHIDFHSMGYHLCRDELGIENKYIPLISEDKGRRPEGFQFKRDGYLVTATAARSNKVEIPYYVSYLDLIPKLLSVTNGKHVHIGNLSPWALLKINRQLKTLGVPNDRFVYIPWVQSVWKSLHQYGVDLYIASFPYGGAITLIEAMGAGVPVALHKHIYSRVLSCIDMGYKDVFYWEDPEKLLEYCKNITSDDLEKLSRIAREQYEKYHDPKILSDVLNHSKVIEAPINVIRCFESNADEVAFWIDKQVSINHLIKRAVYRFMKRIRARFFKSLS